MAAQISTHEPRLALPQASYIASQFEQECQRGDPVFLESLAFEFVEKAEKAASLDELERSNGKRTSGRG